MLFSFIASEAFKLDVLLDCLCMIWVVAILRSYLSLMTRSTDTPVLLVIVMVLREEEESKVLARSYDVRKGFRSKENNCVPEQIEGVVPLSLLRLWRHQQTSVHFLYFPLLFS